MVANLLARSAGLANEIPSEVEDMLGAQMVAEARILAHFVDTAELAGFTPDEINRRFHQIADTPCFRPTACGLHFGINSRSQQSHVGGSSRRICAFVVASKIPSQALIVT